MQKNRSRSLFYAVTDGPFGRHAGGWTEMQKNRSRSLFYAVISGLSGRHAGGWTEMQKNRSRSLFYAGLSMMVQRGADDPVRNFQTKSLVLEGTLARPA